jgi:hypothetical protein
MGAATKAIGGISTTMGQNTIANGYGSVAM